MSYKILIVEDDRQIAERLKAIVSDEGNFEIIGCCSTVSKAYELLRHHSVDVLLCDLLLEDGSGLDVIERAKRVQPNIAIMVITVFTDEKTVVEAVKKGASGYFLKDEDFSQVNQKIYELLKGYAPISPTIARHILNQVKACSDISSEIPKLTERELEVLQLISKGYSQNELASLLGISRYTVASHVKNIYKKLSVASKTEAVFEASKLGILDVIA